MRINQLINNKISFSIAIYFRKKINFIVFYYILFMRFNEIK
jgi:hypothetical protein